LYSSIHRLVEALAVVAEALAQFLDARAELFHLGGGTVLRLGQLEEQRFHRQGQQDDRPAPVAGQVW